MTEIEARLRAIETKGQEIEKEMRSQREKLEKLSEELVNIRRWVRNIVDEMNWHGCATARLKEPSDGK